MSSYPISYFLRQNAFGKVVNEHAMVEELQLIHSPYGHCKDSAEMYVKNPDGSTLHSDAKRFATQLAIGDIVIIPKSGSTAGDQLLIARIESDPIAGVIKGVGIICKARLCGHKDVTSSCDTCRESVERVIQHKDLSEREKLELILNRGEKRHMEDFIAVSRKVAILGQVTAPPKGDSERPWFEWWKKQQSLFKPRRITVTIPYSDVTKTPAQKRRDGDDIVDFLSA